MSMNRQKIEYDARNYRAYAEAKPANATPPITYGAHSTSRDYAGNNMTPARSNADDNLLHTSLITRNRL